jgi:hypothetical protein
VNGDIVVTALISGLIGLVIGLGRDTIRGVGAAALDSFERRRAQTPAMKAVVMDVAENWEGYSYEYGALTVVGMRVSVDLRNFSGQLVKNVRVRMNHRPDGIDSAQMLPALPADEQPVTLTIARELGLDDDRPYREEDPDWLDYYWFEADYEDVHGGLWRLSYNPRDQKQSVKRRSGR